MFPTATPSLEQRGTSLSMNFSALLGEIRRRRIFRMVAVYVVVAWIVIQAASVIFPALAIPRWGISLVVALALLGFPVALVIAWGADRGSHGHHRPSPASGSTEAPTGAADAAPSKAPARPDAPPPDDRSIAVLPFVNMSDDRDNEYFSDGMTEEILNALVKVRDLKVAARTSSFAFKDHRTDVREIAEKLGVATVLEGSVRKSGDRLRITAQLISAAEGYHLWSESYDRRLEDVFAIQDDIARSIVEALRVQLAGDSESGPLVHQTTGDVEAYQLYLKGRYIYNRFTEADLHRSLEFYHRALDVDPRYARAYAGIADSWMNLADDWMAPEEAYPEAKRAARRAIELDETLSEAHTALGKVLGWYDWAFDEAELALRRAVAANPNYADAHWGLASILPPNGQLEEALDEMRVALSLDPLSATFGRFTARFLLYLRRYDEAIEQAQRTLDVNPGAVHALVHMGQANLAMGEPERALETLREADRTGSVLWVRAFVAQALAAVGEREEALSLLESLEAGEAAGYVRAEFVAGGWAALGDADRAFSALGRALSARSSGLIYLHLDPIYDPLRDDPRYAEVVEEIGLRN